MAHKLDTFRKRPGILDVFSGLIKLIAFVTDGTFLAGGEEQVSAWVACDGYNHVCGVAHSDAGGSFIVEFSSDGVNVDYDTAAINVPASGTGAKFSEEVVAEYVRVKYTNGGVAQGSFRFKLYGKAAA